MEPKLFYQTYADLLKRFLKHISHGLKRRLMDVFINDVSAFLPNGPVTNDTIEDVLGKVNGIASKAKRIVLNSNQITQRYYALDPESGKLTHTNARLTAEAIRRLRPHDG